MTNLSQLATRAEQAGVEGQRALLNEVAQFLYPEWPMMPNVIAFERLVNAQAFTDAAIMLLDPHAMFSMADMEDGPGASVIWPQPDGGYVGGYITAKATTPALALLAAICKAKGGE